MAWKLTQLAEADLDRITSEGARAFGVERALDYYDELIAIFELLAEHPYLGRERTELGDGIRLHPFGVHHVFYLVADDDVLIIRILHGRQNWQRAPGL